LSLQLMLEEADLHGMRPASVTILPTSPDALPDIDAWERALGVALKPGRLWDWRRAPPPAGVSLIRERQGWGQFAGLGKRLRPAGWILAAALAVHAMFLTADWARLAGEQQELRQQMEMRFRAAIPDAVAVVDPALQMSRKLAEARHAAGQADGGDFLPMISKAAAELRQLPVGSARSVSFESGRLTLEFTALDQAMVRQTAARLVQAGFIVDGPTASTRGGSQAVVLTVRVQ
jgi:general secretion pathway protein L